MPKLFELLKSSLETRQICVLASVMAGPARGKKLLMLQDGSIHGELGSSGLDQAVSVRIPRLMQEQTPAQISIEYAGESFPVFFDVFTPPPRLIIVGAVHIAISLITFARPLGFYTIVIDPRKVFANRERFPQCDELLLEWPADALTRLDIDVSTYIAILSHDKKFDVPALQVALQKPARFIGILGSRKTHLARLETLKGMGVDESLFTRIHSPIGLDLGAVGAEEIALSVIAQILAVKRGCQLTSTKS